MELLHVAINQHSHHYTTISKTLISKKAIKSFIDKGKRKKIRGGLQGQPSSSPEYKALKYSSTQLFRRYLSVDPAFQDPQLWLPFLLQTPKMVPRAQEDSSSEPVPS